MAVTLMCPNLKCRKVLRVPDEVRGKTVRCSHCGTSLLVPPLKESPQRAAPVPPAKTSG